MKNLLISLVTVFVSFVLTFFCLNNVTGNYNSVKNEVNSNLVIENKDEEPLKIKNVVNTSNILVNYETWKEYHKENIDLSTNFTGIDVNGDETTKKRFLEQLKTGNYIPVKLLDVEDTYQLHTIDEDKEKISKSIKSYSNNTYKYFIKEGKEFPDFNFKDIHDNSFSKEDALGKILVIKCWFIQCRTCVEEFPILNELYDRYEGYDDVMFLSLTFDKAEKLKKFLAKKEFRYPVVAEQKKFIKNEIGIIQYPAHIIIDKQGNIHKIVNNVDSLIIALDDITE